MSLKVCDSLVQISSETTHVGRQLRCAEFLHYAVDPSNLSMRLNRANFCKQRTCPVCNWLRSTKWRIRIFQGLPGLLRDYPGFPFLFLTLTVKNCHFSELRSTVRSLEESWNRLANSRSFPAIGYLKSLEVTRPRDCFYGGQFVGRMGQKLIDRWLTHLKKQPNWNYSLWREYWCEEVHPHIHVVMMVSPSYFNQDEYIDFPHWRSLWQRAARLDYSPVVDIRRIDKLSGAILETSKYCLKSEDMVDLIGCLTVRQLHGLRLLSISGAFRDYFSQAAIDAIAATGELGTEQFQEGVPCWYEWNGKKYRLARLADIYREIEPE